MKIAWVLVMGTMAVGQTVVVDCSKGEPICAGDKVCACKPGTYHPEPSFLVDERGDEYKITGTMDKGWTCDVTHYSPKVSVTLVCTKQPKKQAADGR